MSGLTIPNDESSHTPTVERRWWGRYFREVTADDAGELDELEAAWEAHCPEEASLFDYVVSSGETFTPSTLWPWVTDLKELLNSAGFELDGGPVPEKVSPHRFLGRLAEGTPTAVRAAGPWREDRLRVGSVFIEALSFDTDAAVVDMAFELLPPLPIDELDQLPGYDEPLEGVLAEWVLDARAMLEMLDLVPPEGAVQRPA